MKVLLTGVQGQVGSAAEKILQRQGHDVYAPTIDTLNLKDPSSVLSAFDTFHPDAVLHCAAYTAVDKAESEQELCWQINAEGTRLISQLCDRYSAKLVTVSTDYVFSGDNQTPWSEIPSEGPPLNYYGLSKLEAERHVQKMHSPWVIARTQWVYSTVGHNFVKTILRLTQSNPYLKVVSDQIGSPTYAPHLAKTLCDLTLGDATGFFHVTNDGYCSWHTFATEIVKRYSIDIPVKPVASDEFPTPAKRPLNGRLDNTRLREHNLGPLPTWQEGLQDFVDRFPLEQVSE